jgi:antitoxin MazE
MREREVLVMKTRIISIGNAQGIRIPKSLLEETGLRGEVEICAMGNELVIGRTKKACAGWAAQFRKLARRGDDQE